MRKLTHRAVRILAFVVVAMACLPSFAYQGPRLSAEYEMRDVHPTGPGVEMTFRFVVHAERDTRTTVEKIVLAGLAGPDFGFATFDGGTLAPDTTLTGSATVVVPGDIYEAWLHERPASLYVYSLSAETGDTIRTRVDATRLDVLP